MAVYKVEGEVFWDAEFVLGSVSGGVGAVPERTQRQYFIVYIECIMEDLQQLVIDYFRGKYSLFKQVRFTEIKELPGEIVR